MATNISISVAGRNLIERSKQQQRDARTANLTTTSLTADAEKNRETILRDAPDTAALAPSRVIDTDTAPYVRVNRPTATRGLDNAFLLVTNLNYVFADPNNKHTVHITDPSGSVFVLSGLLDSSMLDFMNRTYLFLPINKTLDDFKRSVPYQYIFATLDTHYTPSPEERPRAVTFIEPMFRLRPFKPIKNTPYTISLVSTVLSGTGNFGAVMAGYLNSPKYYIEEWFTGFGGGEPIIANNVRWGITNQDRIDLYPSNYPE